MKELSSWNSSTNIFLEIMCLKSVITYVPNLLSYAVKPLNNMIIFFFKILTNDTP